MRHKVKYYDQGQISSKEPLYQTYSIAKQAFDYIKTGGIGHFAIVLVLFFVSALLFVCTDVWVGVWANSKLNTTDNRIYLDTYVFLAISSAIFVIIRDMTARLK